MCVFREMRYGITPQEQCVEHAMQSGQIEGKKGKTAHSESEGRD